MTRGRFAPSPTGALHIGNLRTALLALCFARRDQGSFVIRVEDLTTEPSSGHDPNGTEAAQLADLAELGIVGDEAVVRQSDRLGLYADALSDLGRRGLTYPCFCTRREIVDAAAAPHGPSVEGAYPGTCARLSPQEIEQRISDGRTPAIRLTAGGASVVVEDRLVGRYEATVDDFVLRRRDGLPAYNLSVVVDDIAQGVDQVVRGSDLLETTPRQALLYDLFEQRRPEFVHVPLVVGPDGERLAKRHGASSLGELAEAGWSIGEIRALLANSVGVTTEASDMSTEEIVERFDPNDLPEGPWTFDPRRR